MVEDGKVILEKIDTFNNDVDALWKQVSISKFTWCYEFMGLMDLRKFLIA
jgi:hypothetical protein